MSTDRSRRLDRRTAEEILDGASAGRDHALNALLAAAAGAASEAELRGEHAAVAAFRTARLDPAPRPRRLSMIKSTLARMLTTKLAVAAAAAAAVTVGGVAAVAATGHFPGSPDEHSTSRPAAADPATSSVSATESSHGEAKNPGANGTPSGTPSPSLVGLCHAYSAGNKAEHGKALESPAFTVLITTAGGKDKVDAYCAKILADADHGSNGAEPTPSPAVNDHTPPPHPTQGQGNTHKAEPPVTKPTHP